MHITVRRIYADAETTVGEFAIDGEKFGYTLEDTAREEGVKIPGETAIPSGEYAITLHPKSRLLKRYVARFGDQQKHGMLLLKDVPNFEGVLIHCGNSQEHTDGCLLVGRTANLGVSECSVGESRNAYRQIYPRILGALLAGEDVKISISDDYY